VMDATEAPLRKAERIEEMRLWGAQPSTQRSCKGPARGELFPAPSAL